MLHEQATRARQFAIAIRVIPGDTADPRALDERLITCRNPALTACSTAPSQPKT
jgi:hypothetical protein